MPDSTHHPYVLYRVVLTTGKTYLSLILYRRSESGSNLLDAEMPKLAPSYNFETNFVAVE